MNYEEIDKRFDEKFPKLFYSDDGCYGGCSYTSCGEEVRDFLHTEIETARQEERTRTIEEIIEKIPSANNPANAIMDEYREGENSMRKKILETLLTLKSKAEEVKGGVKCCHCGCDCGVRCGVHESKDEIEEK